MKDKPNCCLCGRPAEMVARYWGGISYTYLRSSPEHILCHECTLSAAMQDALMWPDDVALIIGELE